MNISLRTSPGSLTFNFQLGSLPYSMAVDLKTYCIGEIIILGDFFKITSTILQQSFSNFEKHIGARRMD